MKKIFAALLFLAAGLCLEAQTLSWDIKFLKGRAWESVPISRAIRMETGEGFLINIMPDSDCFCYVVLYDSEREITVLHDKPVRGRDEITLGPFSLEHPPGTETLYVIMSMEKQARLEGLIQSVNSSPGSRQNADNLYREIAGLQNTASGLGEPASSFIASGGTSRGGSEEYITRFTDKSLYVRAITVRH